ncbi:MAG: MDR family MFS transporter [Anaerolineaceae bacterium]
MHIQYKYIVAIVAVFGLFMDLLDGTIVNVAIPTLAKDFNATTTTIEWVVTGYLLSLAVFIPVSGWAADRFGTKRTFLFALTVFTIASTLCAFAWNVESLIAFRFLQGVGGGMLTPVGTTMLFRAFPPAERSKAAGLMVIPTTVAPASGPVIGGFLVQYVSWEWIFLVNIPVGIAGLIISWRFLKEQKEPVPGRFDPYGFVLSASGLGSVLYGLAEAGSRGFDDPMVLFFLVSGAVLLTAFVFAELRISEPMIDVRLFKNRLFRACSAAQFVGMIGFSGSLFLLPIILQAERGMSPFQSGLTTFPMAIGVMVMAQPTSRIYRIVGPRRLIAAGLIVASLTSFALAATDFETSQWVIRELMFIRGLGFGLMLVPLQAATFATIAPADTGRASSLYSVSRMVGQSFGVAVIATVLTNRLAYHGAFLGAAAPAPIRDHALLAFRDGFIVAGILTLMGMVVALFIKDRDAAATMRPRSEIVAIGSVEEEALAAGLH